MKFKAWMVYLLGYIVAFAISSTISDPSIAGSVIGEYALWGIIVLGIYYLTRRLFFGKKSNLKKINNNHST
jgi:hypothetical protein